MGNDVFSGDDAIGLHTGTIPFRPIQCDGEPIRLFIYNRNIRDVEIANNWLSSVSGRAVACGLARPRSAETDLTAMVENIRAREIFGRQGGQAASLVVNCIPRRPLAIFPGDTCPSAGTAAMDPLLFPTRAPQVRNVHFSNMNLFVDLALQPDGIPVQQAARIYTEDIGSVEDITFENITIQTLCISTCGWTPENQPKEMLQIERSGLNCEHFIFDPVTGGFVSSGFTQIGVSHRNFQVTVQGCQFIDDTGSFATAWSRRFN